MKNLLYCEQQNEKSGNCSTRSLFIACRWTVIFSHFYLSRAVNLLYLVQNEELPVAHAASPMKYNLVRSTDKCIVQVLASCVTQKNSLHP